MFDFFSILAMTSAVALFVLQFFQSNRLDELESELENLGRAYRADENRIQSILHKHEVKFNAVTRRFEEIEDQVRSDHDRLKHVGFALNSLRMPTKVNHGSK